MFQVLLADIEVNTHTITHLLWCETKKKTMLAQRDCIIDGNCFYKKNYMQTLIGLVMMICIKCINLLSGTYDIQLKIVLLG